MDSDNIKYLKKLKGVLDNIMGSTRLGYKYEKALDNAIETMTSKEVYLITRDFAVNVVNYKEGIIIDIFSRKDNVLIESIEMSGDDIIDDTNAGEA